MLRIGICDDDREYREKIHDIVIHSIFSYDDAQVVHYMSGKQVVDDIEKEEFDIDLLLLDINMPEYDGLNTAKYIRENNVDVDIIFITVSAEHIFDGYTYKAFSYILKPVDKKRLDDEIGRYMTERSKCTNCLHISVNGKKEQILLDKVYYFEGEKRKIKIYQKGESISFYAKMNELEEMLKQYGFVRCHQSYLVNMDYIKDAKDDFELRDGTIVPVRVRGRKEILDQYYEYFVSHFGEKKDQENR